MATFDSLNRSGLAMLAGRDLYPERNTALAQYKLAIAKGERAYAIRNGDTSLAAALDVDIQGRTRAIVETEFPGVPGWLQVQRERQS